MNYLSNEASKIIRAYAREQSIGMRDIAERIGASPVSLSRWLNQKRPIGKESLNKLQRLVGTQNNLDACETLSTGRSIQCSRALRNFIRQSVKREFSSPQDFKHSIPKGAKSLYAELIIGRTKYWPVEHLLLICEMLQINIYDLPLPEEDKILLLHEQGEKPGETAVPCFRTGDRLTLDAVALEAFLQDNTPTCTVPVPTSSSTLIGTVIPDDSLHPAYKRGDIVVFDVSFGARKDDIGIYKRDNHISIGIIGAKVDDGWLCESLDQSVGSTWIKESKGDWIFSEVASFRGLLSPGLIALEKSSKNKASDSLHESETGHSCSAVNTDNQFTPVCFVSQEDDDRWAELAIEIRERHQQKLTLIGKTILAVSLFLYTAWGWMQTMLIPTSMGYPEFLPFYGLPENHYGGVVYGQHAILAFCSLVSSYLLTSVLYDWREWSSPNNDNLHRPPENTKSVKNDRSPHQTDSHEAAILTSPPIL